MLLIKSLNETIQGFCAQNNAKLLTFTCNSFKIPVKEWDYYPSFPSAFLKIFEQSIYIFQAFL